jgi:unsaturated rhamnogalacturonyl hydrolase
MWESDSDNMFRSKATVKGRSGAVIALVPFAFAAAAVTQPSMPAASTVLADTRRVADWQLAHRTTLAHMPAARPSALDPRDWQQATFWVAMTELADRDARYRAPILATGRELGWTLSKRPLHADDQLIAQTWAWAAQHSAGMSALVPARAYFENVFARRPRGSLEFVQPERGDPACTVRWCWCDALFMAPAAMLRLGQLQGDPRYAAFVHEEFRATADYLYDPAERLFFRDSRFFDRRDAAGRKLFWSRGNGWVLAGLARVLQVLPRNDPQRGYYLKLFRDMAARVVSLQKPDGYWAPSLLDNGAATPPESSGTGFFTYALAWGVGAGVLDAKLYRPAALRGWTALGRAVQTDGMLGWVQQVSDRPDSVAATDTQFYGTGAYLLAGTAMYDLARKKDVP